MEHFNVVLFQPEIPGNTGSIGRTCVALNLRLILIRPYGFDISEKSVRRAGLDYWKYVKLVEYDSWEDFLTGEKPQKEKLFFFSRFATKSLFEAKFPGGHYLIFGRETKGLPENLSKDYPQNFYSLPMFSEHIRSLNLANVATAVCYESIRQMPQNQ